MTASAALEVEPAELLVEPGALLGVVVAAERDGALPDALDRREQLGAGLFGDHLAEQRAEQPDLGRERVARTGRPDPERLGGDRRRDARCLGCRHPRPAPGPFRAQAATGPQPSATATFPRLVW